MNEAQPGRKSGDNPTIHGRPTAGGRYGWLRRTGWSAGFVVLLWAAPGLAQEPAKASEVSELKEKVAAQEKLIEELLDWKRKTESKQASLPPTDSSPSPAASARAVVPASEPALAELNERLDELDTKVSLMPNISGYYDFDYMATSQSGSHNAFDQHHVSLHLSKEYKDFRFFSEIEFEHGVAFEAANGVVVEAQGELNVEQAWGEYLLADLLTVRGGKILLPNYWNVNHYPNVVLSVRRPLIVREVFPESLTGIMAYGTKSFGAAGVSYSLQAGNGQGDSSASEDDNNAKAVAGRLTFHLPLRKFLDKCDVSLVGYTDDPANGAAVHVWGGEVQLRKGPFELLSEYADRTGDQPERGLYLQPSYRFDEQWAVFYRFDWLEVGGGDDIRENTVGVNFRPIPPVSLKLELFHSGHSTIPDYRGAATSIAIAF